MPSEPKPISATYAGGAAQLIVTFDEPLIAAPFLVAANWTIRLNGYLQQFGSGSASGDVVTINRTDNVVDPGPDVVSFTPPPFDVVGVSGVPAPAFLGFPVTAP